MIRVDIKRSVKAIVEVTIQDHAGSGIKGEDLVCAGVSSIAVGTLNALDQLCNSMCDLTMKDAYIHVNVNTHTPTVQIILETMCIQLETMQEMYSKYIKINDQEV